MLIGPTGDVNAVELARLSPASWVRSAVWESPYAGAGPGAAVRAYGLTSMARAMEVARRYDLAAAIPRLGVRQWSSAAGTTSLCPADWAQRVADLADGEVWTLPTGSHMPVLTNGPELVTFIKRAAGVYNGQ